MEILNVKVDNLTIKRALEKVDEFLAGEKQHYIVTPNPEFVVRAQKDNEFREILNQADLNVPDGIGLVFASRFLGRPLKQRIAGIDLMEEICCKAADNNWPVFFLGAREGIAEKAIENLKVRYPNLKAGVLKEDLSNKEEVFESSDAILFVAFGAPKQEKWIRKNLPDFPSVKLAMGVGGGFDFLSGKVKRAPRVLRNFGLEWFWRLLNQPWRLKRIFNATIIFPWLVIREKRKA